VCVRTTAPSDNSIAAVIIIIIIIISATLSVCEKYCLPKVKFTLGQATNAHMYLGARWGWVVNTTPRPFYPCEIPGTHFIGGWVSARAGLDGCGKYCLPTGIRSPDRPASSESLYRLRYLGTSAKRNRQSQPYLRK
jgi:hypothetical protein